MTAPAPAPAPASGGWVTINPARVSPSLAEELVARVAELERKLAKLEERIDQVGYQAGA